MSLSAKKYEPLLNEGKDDIDDRRRSIDYALQLPINRKRDKTVRLLVVLNVVLAGLLLGAVIVLWEEKASVPAPPYSPAWEAVRHVNKRFARDDRLYPANETDAEVDKLWLNFTGPSNGHIILPMEEARKNVPSAEMYYEPGYYIYGLSMFHQVHCLDLIRRSFYPPTHSKHYFPNKSDDEVVKHKYHCFDYLRQSIMCSGDVTMDHWFNYTWTEPSFAAGGEGKAGDDWMAMLNPEYERLTPKQRHDHAPLLWDTTHFCRDYDALYQWVKDRQLVDDAYIKEFGIDEDIF
ncbi:hypothetical protein CONLIGDRAFT_648198 [Coniochaeta ligniaria NRRL 30616]|uniref:Tat pathway signal sequence n=1 Tax=Coniochaeta ligniaria NRRL 30616 TaxID=1408157 RepID=A0A1J7ICY4_9PEZI|nr:hypothetical protein CONLIGDRAFT_648198 [Coniochaeta ligniaria NRRL 30616]